MSMRAEEKLPQDILDKCLNEGKSYYWRVNDIPEVIQSAREAGLSSIGGSLFFIGQPHTPSSEVGTCECYEIAVSVDTPLGKEWDVTIAETARQAIQQFSELPKKYDFHKEGFRFPTVEAYHKNGGDLDEIMYFEWSVEDEKDHRKFEDDLKCGRIRTSRPTPAEWKCKPAPTRSHK